MRNEKLLPCPFCGNKVRWCDHDPQNPDQDHECDQIVCPFCDFNFDVVSDSVRKAHSIREAKVFVAKVWNRRNK